MPISAKLDQLYLNARANKWLGYFAVFNRIALAAGFLPSGFVKIMGERFTDLHNNQPMGHYLEALYHTGYYYTTIGILQVTAAILLLIPRTAILGALLYFPIILNICILSFSVRFEGSLFTAPLMVIANLYLLAWNYDKLKFILPFNHPPKQEAHSNKFPVKFFAGVVAVIGTYVLVITHVYDIMPRNTLSACTAQCKDSANPQACNDFCNCIHQKGQPLNKCLDEYHKALKGNGRITK